VVRENVIMLVHDHKARLFAGVTNALQDTPRILFIWDVWTCAGKIGRSLIVLAAELDQERHARMKHNARSLVLGGHTRRAIDLSKAADVLWTYSSPELYDLLVRRRNWTLRRYSAFIAEAIANVLL